MATRHKIGDAVFQAFEHLGRDGVRADVIEQSRASLSPRDKKTLPKKSRYTLGWISILVKQVVFGFTE